MSKHSLIATGLGLGLMAASMGASAQVHTFDYSSMYYGSTAGGSKYVSFVPTIIRGASAVNGAAGVLMLEMFQPVSGSASTWAYALGGAVGSNAGGAAAPEEVSLVLANGLSVTNNHYLGDVASISHGFSQSLTVSSQACQVTFAAVIGTNDQLAFKSIAATPVGWTVVGDVTIATGSAATQTVVIDSGAWGNASVTLATYAANTNHGISGIGSTSTTGAGASSDTVTYTVGFANSTVVNSYLTARNRCVPAYTARATSGGTTITGETIGMVRIY